MGNGAHPPMGLDLEAIAEKCRLAGLKVTPQRLAIYAALLGTDDHPSPEALFKTVQPSMPGISPGTVYKTLDALERAGLVSQVALPDETKRYDANLAPHHHLICTRCRNILDIADPRLDAIAPPEDLGGFEPTEVKVQILGTCARCRGQDKERTET